ncbi:hypothetical protein M407DRAFT_17292 [Tulasnella calospora MUT 4182]|uniref:Uncharacterized protein n=1 Tax=Tulasnella calospora MUT 4182 TaxID=1051891 RepID=A0A0C3QM87_9AGAM|nr:hypothetical protein M407DRAFT_17292 [Tulasnella calospora MUT 4182]
MLVFRGIDRPQGRLVDHPDYEYGEGLRSYRFPASPFGSPERTAEGFVIESPDSSMYSSYPRSVSSASDTSYYEVDSYHPFAMHAPQSSPSYASSSPSEWGSSWGGDERPANGVWSPTFGPRPPIDNGIPSHGSQAPRDSHKGEQYRDEDHWEGNDSSLHQELPFERPANSSFKGLDSASSEIPQEYLESEFSPDRRKRSLSSEEIKSLAPFHIICWASAGHEKLWTPKDPHIRKILDAYLAEDSRGLEPGLYLWHDECGEERTLHVFEPKTHTSCDQAQWKETSIADAKEPYPLPPRLANLQVGFVSVMPRKGRDEDEEILVPDNCISTILSADKRWKVCDLPAGFVYRWREVSGATFMLDTGPSQFESSTRQSETFGAQDIRHPSGARRNLKSDDGPQKDFRGWIIDD